MLLTELCVLPGFFLSSLRAAGKSGEEAGGGHAHTWGLMEAFPSPAQAQRQHLAGCRWTHHPHRFWVHPFQFPQESWL